MFGISFDNYKFNLILIFVNISQHNIKKGDTAPCRQSPHQVALQIWRTSLAEVRAEFT